MDYNAQQALQAATEDFVSEASQVLGIMITDEGLDYPSYALNAYETIVEEARRRRKEGTLDVDDLQALDDMNSEISRMLRNH